jgi:hypothetical protein
MNRKKRKRKSTGEALSPETASAVKTLLKEIETQEESGEPLETSLQRIRSQLGVSSERDLAIVTAMGGSATDRMAKLLRALLGSVSDKRVLKGIRRSLYRIEQRGISIEPVEMERQERPALRPPTLDLANGFISAVDSEGSQVVFLTVSRRPKGLWLLQAIVNDTRGLIEFDRVETSKRGFREFYQSIRETEKLPMVDVDPGYCRFLLEEAAHRSEHREASLPAAYLTSKRDLERIVRMETPPVFLLLDEEEIGEDMRLVNRSFDLFQTEWFSSWLLPQEEAQKYADLIKDAEESRLVLNPAQKEIRLQEVYRKALVELFSEERKERYRRRLEAMAYVLLKEGKEEDARAALATSIDLRSPFSALEPNPFLMRLVTRSIHAIMAHQKEEKDEEPSLIVKP